ncbi:TIGR02530 family flagellar biosynthesis protein [Desnuesiella massiliensis]|uniref:TIGR02530 family flagellar biosynthesis protein n=1 Tax=Desnuesiella massiliensis TaxID=1650662 RepID=UPI0006E45455|nr:TIGR02530 family flagellar biosynthesis protein [Desnuesiella massiliensis]
MGFRVINGKLYEVGNFPQYNNVNKERISNNTKESFKAILEKEIQSKDSFKISNHAAERIKDIELDDGDMKKINEGINLAEEKGSKNSVLLYKDIALVASIENRTIITAVQKERTKENIFTNIDSVVIL